jgi:hypothetical protein
VQGLFAAALLIGIRRRCPEILVLATAIGLKFAIHMIISPVGRLAVPAIALELLTIPLGAVELERSSNNLRVQSALVGAIAAVSLLVLTPPLVGLVQRRDSSELPGVRFFALESDGTPAVSADGIPIPHEGASGAAFTLRNPNDVRTISIDHPGGSGGSLRFEAVRAQ